MLTSFKNRYNLNKYINYMLIGYALCIPISKAGVNLFESLIILLWLIEGKWKEKFSLLKVNLLSISIISLIIVSLIASFWSISIPEALSYIGKYRHFIIILIIYTSLDKRFIRYILSAFLLGMFISEMVSYGIFFELFKYKNISPQDPTAFMSHTDYSAYLAFTSIILLERFLSDINIKSKIVYGMFFITVTGNLFVNGGRTGQVIFIVLILITFIMSIKNKIKAIVMSFCLITVIFTTAYNISPNFYNRANYAIKDVKNMIYKNNYGGSFGTRVSLWIVGFDKFKDNLLLGAGIGNEMDGIENYAKYRGFNEKHIARFADHHNSFVTFAVQLGIFGLFISLLIFYSIYKLVFISTKYRILKVTFFITFFLWSMIGISFHLMNSMIFFTFFAGLLNKISYFEIKEGCMKI